jgi:hypothetical protein
MKCAIEDGKDAVTINNIHKYCYNHYQIYDSLRKLYTEVSKTHTSLSWNDFLTNVLDANYKESWKTHLVDSTNGKTLDTIADVARTELEQQQGLETPS